MKTPDEIKNGLECHSKAKVGKCELECFKCNLFIPGYICRDVCSDALAYIQRLESRLAQVERERDAALEDIANYAHAGTICKHYANDCHFTEEGCPLYPSDCGSYEWRGVCPENTKEAEQ